MIGLLRSRTTFARMSSTQGSKKKMSAIRALTSVIPKLSTRTRVISTRKVHFPPAECNFDTYDCDTDTLECDFNTHECDFNTHEWDFNFSTRTRLVSVRRVRFPHAKCAIYTHESKFSTRRV
jgi:hypothetical protein